MMYDELFTKEKVRYSIQHIKVIKTNQRKFRAFYVSDIVLEGDNQRSEDELSSGSDDESNKEDVEENNIKNPPPTKSKTLKKESRSGSNKKKKERNHGDIESREVPKSFLSAFSFWKKEKIDSPAKSQQEEVVIPKPGPKHEASSFEKKKKKKSIIINLGRKFLEDEDCRIEESRSNSNTKKNEKKFQKKEVLKIESLRERREARPKKKVKRRFKSNAERNPFNLLVCRAKRVLGF